MPAQKYNCITYAGMKVSMLLLNMAGYKTAIGQATGELWQFKLPNSATAARGDDSDDDGVCMFKDAVMSDV